jgi:hypothetical protein
MEDKTTCTTCKMEDIAKHVQKASYEMHHRCCLVLLTYPVEKLDTMTASDLLDDLYSRLLHIAVK